MEISLVNFTTHSRLLGTRDLALPIRDRIEDFLDNSSPEEKITLNFLNVNPTQSFIDELLGTLVLERGSMFLSRVIMKNCNDDIKAILHFVISDRLKIHLEKNKNDSFD